MKSFLRGVFVAGALTSAVAQPAQAINIVQNPGFETGDLSSWSTNDDAWFPTSNFPFAGLSAYEGNYFASTGCLSLVGFCNLSQTVTTVPGSTYNLTFAFNPGRDASDGGGDTQVYWDGALKLDIAGGDLAWTVYTLTNLLATSTTTTLLFSGYQNRAFNGLDAISVEAMTATPVPAALPLFATGLAGLAWLARRRKKLIA